MSGIGAGEHGTPGRKIISPNVANDRIITKFPQAFHESATPNKKLNFHPKVRDACTQQKTGTVGLKICKAVIVGDVAVGKTCLVNRFCHNIFDRDYKATIGVDFEVEKFSILSVPFNLQIWDTAGQERFKCIAASYYRHSNVVIVAFDLNDPESLTHCRHWTDDACKSSTDPLVFLVGAKKDLVNEHNYKEMEEQAMQLANEIGAEFWAVSSLSGENVKEFFFRLVSITFDRAVLKEIEDIQSHKQQQIGTIKVDSADRNLYETKNKGPLKCCT